MVSSLVVLRVVPPKVWPAVKKLFNHKDFLRTISFSNLRVNPTRFPGSFPPQTHKNTEKPSRTGSSQAVREGLNPGYLAKPLVRLPI